MLLKLKYWITNSATAKDLKLSVIIIDNDDRVSALTGGSGDGTYGAINLLSHVI